MKSNAKIVTRQIPLELHVIRSVEKVASEKKVSFNDAVIFLLQGVLTPKMRKKHR